MPAWPNLPAHCTALFPAQSQKESCITAIAVFGICADLDDRHASAAIVYACLCFVQVDVEDISRVYSLFVDVKRSTQFMIEFQEQYMFNEVPGMEEVAAAGMEISS